MSEIIRKDLHINDNVLIRRAGDVIPEVIKIIKINCRQTIKNHNASFLPSM